MISDEELREYRQHVRGSKFDVHLTTGNWVGPVDLVDELLAAREAIKIADLFERYSPVITTNELRKKLDAYLATYGEGLKDGGGE